MHIQVLALASLAAFLGRRNVGQHEKLRNGNLRSNLGWNFNIHAKPSAILAFQDSVVNRPNCAGRAMVSSTTRSPSDTQDPGGAPGGPRDAGAYAANASSLKPL